MRLTKALYILSTLGFAHLHAQSLFIGKRAFNLDIVNRNSSIIFDTMGNKPVIENFTFWISGVQGLDTLCIADNIFANKSEWVYGPAHTTGNQWINPWESYRQVSKTEIDYHNKNYLNSGYSPIASIVNWPAAISHTGYSKVLAPFVDLNIDGKYEPENGDYPYVFGENNVVQVITDSWPKSILKSKSLPVDLTIQYFTLKNVQDMIFMRITACNRSNIAINKFRLSSVLNAQIGNDLDDAVETNNKLNSVHFYNGYQTDAIYGANWPTAGFVFLSEKLANTIYFRNEISAVYGTPITAVHVFNLAHGNWLSGKKMTYGGSGLDGQLDANWVYSGNSDTATGRPEWKDELNPGKRTIVASTTDYTLAAGACKVIDAAIYVLADGNTTNKRIDASNSVISKYKAQQFALSITTPKKQVQTKTFVANPGSKINNLPKGLVEIYTINGKQLGENQIEPIAPAQPGMYLLMSDGKLIGKLWVLN